MPRVLRKHANDNNGFLDRQDTGFLRDNHNDFLQNSMAEEFDDDFVEEDKPLFNAEDDGIPSEPIGFLGNDFDFTDEPAEEDIDRQPNTILPVDSTQTDRQFVDDVENLITDDKGNTFRVQDMLVIQDSNTLELSIFITDADNQDPPAGYITLGTVTPVTQNNVDSVDVMQSPDSGFNDFNTNESGFSGGFF